jgi:hypothetical protein
MPESDHDWNGGLQAAEAAIPNVGGLEADAPRRRDPQLGTA